jgi:hypothetical protein
MFKIPALYGTKIFVGHSFSGAVPFSEPGILLILYNVCDFKAKIKIFSWSQGDPRGEAAWASFTTIILSGYAEIYSILAPPGC